MLIYEKYVEETVDGNTVLVRHLFGTDANVPAVGDEQLVYEDADGDVITPVDGDTYVDGGSANGIQRIKRLSDDKAVNVLLDDEVIIGEVAEKVVKSIKVKTKPTKLTYAVNETLDLTGMVVQATYEDGDKENVDGYTTDPADGATLDTTGDVTVTVTYEEKTTTFKVTVE